MMDTGWLDEITTEAVRRLNDDHCAVVFVMDSNPLVRAGLISQIKEYATKDVMWDREALTTIDSATEGMRAGYLHKVVALDSQTPGVMELVGLSMRISRSLQWLMVIGMTPDFDLSSVRNFNPIFVTSNPTASYDPLSMTGQQG